MRAKRMRSRFSAMAASLERLEQAIHGRLVEVLVEGALVDLEHGGGAAGGQALDLLEREAAVRRGLADADAELPLEVRDDALGAHDRAGERAAHLEHVTADRLEVVHRVE